MTNSRYLADATLTVVDDVEPVDFYDRNVHFQVISYYKDGTVGHYYWGSNLDECFLAIMRIRFMCTTIEIHDQRTNSILPIMI